MDNDDFKPTQPEVLFTLLGLAAGIIVADQSANEHELEGNTFKEGICREIAQALIDNLIQIGEVFWEEHKAVLMCVTKEYQNACHMLVNCEHIPFLQPVPDLFRMDDSEINDMIGLGDNDVCD